MFGQEVRTAFVVLLLAQNIFGDSPFSSQQSNHTHATEQSNSSIASAKSGTETNSHGSKLLQSVPLIANHPQHQLLSRESTSENFTNIVRLEDVLVIFDLDGVATNWPQIRHELRSNCQHDMNEYFRGLQQHKMWAIKSKLQFCFFLLSYVFVEASPIDLRCTCGYISCGLIYCRFCVYKVEKVITTKLRQRKNEWQEKFMKQ